jgi:hypothetical protein
MPRPCWMPVRPDRTSVRAKATGGFTCSGARGEIARASARFEVRLVQLWYDIHDGDGGSGYEGHAEMDITGLVAI